MDQNLEGNRSPTFCADAGAVHMRAGRLVAAAACGGAVGAVQTRRTADGAVVSLTTTETSLLVPNISATRLFTSQNHQ